MLERNHYHAVSTIECKINPGKLGTYATEIVLIHLANDDFISANRYWNAVINCPTDINTAVTGIKSIDEAKIIADAVVNNHGYQVMNNLINFWEDDNGPKCQETLKSYYFKNLETEFVKMVQNLKTIPTGSGTALEPGQEKEVDLQNVNDLGDFEDNLQDDFADQLDLATEIVQEEEEDDDDLL